MVKVFTIKEGVPTSIFGFERSQLARQKIFEDLGIEHSLVLTNLDSLVPNYVETLTELGFKNFHHVIFDQSDLARVSPSVKEESLNKEGISYIEYTSNGSVGLHEGYISCSMSECFANSAVEASANGLICLLSDVDLAHKYYGSLCSNTRLFNSQEELLSLLKGYVHSEEGFSSSTFAKNYTYSEVLPLYKEVLSL